MPTDAERWRFLADHKLTLDTDGGDYTGWLIRAAPGRLCTIVSNYLESQAVTSTYATDLAIHRVFVRTMTFKMVISFRMHATRASFFGFPAATSRR